jgi:hypothetical protein
MACNKFYNKIFGSWFENFNAQILIFENMKKLLQQRKNEKNFCNKNDGETQT